MDYDTGQRVLFGAEGAPAASLPDAVVASCSILNPVAGPRPRVRWLAREMN